MKSYNSKNVNVIISYKGGQEFLTAFSKGSEIKASKNADRYTHHTGIKGDTTFAATNDDSGKIEFSLKMDSPSNKLLDQLTKDDETFDIQVVDGNDVSKGHAGGTSCVINKQADWSRGAEIKDRKWVVLVPNLDMGDE